MTVRLTVGDAKDPVTTRRTLSAPLREGTLPNLFENLSRRHPELAPLLEDATHQNDLEILVNDHRLSRDEADRYRLHDGDRIALFVKSL